MFTGPTHSNRPQRCVAHFLIATLGRHMHKAFGRRARTGSVPEAPKGTIGQCEGVRLIIGRRGFCQLSADGARAYVSVAELHASLTKAASRPAEERSRDSLGLLQEAAATHADTLAEIAGKVASGKLEEAEAARQIMVLLGPATYHAVAMALTSSMATAKLTRARQARRASMPASLQASSAATAGSSSKKRPSVQFNVAQVSTSADEALKEVDEAVEGRPSKRLSIMKRESSTGLTTRMSEGLTLGN